MKKTPSQKTIEPNEPISKSTQLKVIQNLVKNKFLTHQDKIKVLLSIRKKDEE